MKLSFIRAQLASYDKEKSAYRRVAGDYTEVKQLRQLATQQGQSDRDLTAEELYKVFVVLLPSSQSGRTTDVKVGFLLNRIRSSGGVEFEAAIGLHHARPSLFNKENYVALLQQPEDLKKILAAWNKLPPNLRTIENMVLLQEQAPYLDEMIELLSSASGQAQLSGHSAQEHFLRVCLLSMIEVRERKSSENILIKDLPRGLITRTNIKSFRDVNLASKKSRNQVITEHDISWAKILRADILKSIAALSLKFNLQEGRIIFTTFCKQTERHFHGFEELFLALPDGLRTVENLKLLTSIKYNRSLITKLKSLAAPLQTNENFGRLVATAGNSQNNDVFTHVYEDWNKLPLALQTPANFAAMHINSDQYGSVVYLSMQFFNSLEQKTQENFTKLFSLKMDSSKAHALREFSHDFFYRIPAADFVNSDVAKLTTAARAWELLPEALKTEVTLGLLVGHGEERKGENATAVHLLFSLLPQVLRTEENFNEIIANSQAISHFKADPSTVELDTIFPRIGPVADQSVLNRIIQVAQNLDPEGISILVKQFKAVDYIFRLVPPMLRSQENFGVIVERADSIQVFMATPEAQQLLALLITVPPHLFTQALYNLVIQLTEATNQAALDVGLNRIRDQVRQQIARGGINVPQSTHTASVHKSVSESAISLMNHYGEQIDTGNKLDDVIENLKDWIMSVNVVDLGLNDEKMEPEEIEQYRVDLSHQLEAARRAVVTLSNPVYAFTDLASQVSTRQLMALVWIAIRDDELRISPRQDANRKMVVGLYDVQRGYNQTADFTDSNRNAADYAICSGGTFNKLMEIPWGIHPNVQLRYITTERAGNKIPAATRELVLEYIKELQQAEADKANFVEQIDKLISDGIELIWEEQIKPKLAMIIYDEYGSLYKGDKDQAFLDLIETGQYVDLSELHLERYQGNPKYEMESEEPKPSTPAAIDSSAVASVPSATVDSPVSGSGTSSQATSFSTVTFFSSSSVQASWLRQVGNRLENEITAVQGFDPKLKAGLLSLKQLTKQLDKSDLSLEDIGKLERNLSRLIRDLRPNSESVSLAQEAYQHCFTTLSAIVNELEEKKQSMNDNRAG